MIPKAYISRSITNEDLYLTMKDGLKIGEIREVKKNLNNTEVLTEWSRFELRIEGGNQISLHHRWSKDKFLIIIVLIIISLFVYIPILFLLYKGFKERAIGKNILEVAAKKLND